MKQENNAPIIVDASLCICNEDHLFYFHTQTFDAVATSNNCFYIKFFVICQLTKTSSIDISASLQSSCLDTFQQVISNSLDRSHCKKNPGCGNSRSTFRQVFTNTFIIVYGLHPLRIITVNEKKLLPGTCVKYFQSTGFFHSTTFLSQVPLSRLTCWETTFPINTIGG